MERTTVYLYECDGVAGVREQLERLLDNVATMLSQHVYEGKLGTDEAVAISAEIVELPEV